MSILTFLVVAIAITAALVSLIIEATIVLRALASEKVWDGSPSFDHQQNFDAYLADFMWWK